MFSLSIRSRLFLLVGIFSLVAVVVSIAGSVGVSSVEYELLSLIDGTIEARRIAQELHGSFEEANSIANALVSVTAGDEVGRYLQEQDVLFTKIDTDLSTLGKLLGGEDLALIEQLRPVLEEYKRHNVQLRKLVNLNAADRAVQLYLGEHSEFMQKMRDLVQDTVEHLQESDPAATKGLRDLRWTMASINDWLGQMVLESNDEKMATISRRLAGLFDKYNEQLASLQEAGVQGQRVATRLSAQLDLFRKSATEIEQLTRVNDRHHRIELARKGDASVQAARSIMHQIQTRIYARVDAKHQEVERATERSRIFFALVSIFGIATASIFALFTTRRISNGVEGVQRVVRQIADASLQVRAATQAMAQRTSEEASSIEETSSTMEQMSATVEQNRSGASRAKDLAERNGEAAQNNAGLTSQAADAMTALKQAGGKVSEISETVTEIAFQTNILALNASVEAARAGEHGRGFAVVAAEVRTLAQRTGQAAREISELIKDSLRRIDNGVELVTRSSSEMKRMVDGSREYITLVANINAAAQEQASGINQISQAMVQLNSVVQSNSAQAEEMAAAAENLMLQSTDLKRALSLIAGGSDLDESVVSAAPPQLAPKLGKRLKAGGERGTEMPIHSLSPDSDFASF